MRSVSQQLIYQKQRQVIYGFSKRCWRYYGCYDSGVHSVDGSCRTTYFASVGLGWHVYLQYIHHHLFTCHGMHTNLSIS